MKYLNLLFTLFSLNILLAQNTPFEICDMPGQNSCRCSTAPVFASPADLDGFTFSMDFFQHNEDNIDDFCAGTNTATHNPTWIAFTAQCLELDMNILFSNCDREFGAGPGRGTQFAMYASCMDAQQENCIYSASNVNTCQGDGTYNITVPNLNIGQTYYMVFDGCFGDICDLEIDILTPNCTFTCAAESGTITASLNSVCSEEITFLEILGQNTTPEYENTLYVTDDQGIIIVNLPNNSELNFEISECGTYTAYSYNYPAGSGLPPQIGDNINTIDCGTICCELSSTTFTVEDNEPPILTNFPADLTITCIDQLTPMEDLEWTDNCLVMGMVSGTEVNTLTNCTSGIVSRTWSITDSCGNTAAQTQNITVDPITPIAFLNPPADVTVDCDAIGAYNIPIMYTNNELGACLSMGSVVPTFSTLPNICGGSITMVWDTIDACGTAISHTQTITVTSPDVINFINPPNDITVNCDAIGSYDIPLTYSNNESGACLFEGTVFPTFTSLPNTCGGTASIVWDTVDICGNTISHTQMITVNPPQAISFINPPSDITIACDDVTNFLVPLPYTNNETGSCLSDGNSTPTIVSGAPNICGGIYTIEWNATDACGNTISHTQTINTDPPEPIAFVNPPADVTVNCDAIGTYNTPLMYTNNEAGACLFEGNVIPTFSTLPTLCGGTFSMVWDTTDACGNFISHTQTITVPAPNPINFVNPPNDISIPCDDASNYVIPILYSNNEMGACLFEGNAQPIIIAGNPNLCGGSYTIQWNAMDACGTTISHNQTVSSDPISPTSFINPPADVTIACDENITPNDLMFTNGEIGQCLFEGSTSPVILGSPDICGDTYSIVWEVIDICGSTINYTQSVTTTPVNPIYFISPPSDISISCDSAYIPEALFYTNDESGTCLLEGNVSPTIQGSPSMCGGTYTIQWDTTDICGNYIEHLQTITVNSPDVSTFISPPNDITVDCGTSLNPPTLQYTNGANDFCLIEGIVSPTVGSSPTLCGGSYEVVWDTIDACGNILSYTQHITVSSIVEPSFINPPSDITLSCDEASTSIPELSYTNNGSGSCLTEGVTPGSQSGTFDICGGSLTNTWTTVTACGFTLLHSQIVTVLPFNPFPLNIPTNLSIIDCDLVDSIRIFNYSYGDSTNCQVTGQNNASINDPNYNCGDTVTLTWNLNFPCIGDTIISRNYITKSCAAVTFIEVLPNDTTLVCNAVPMDTTILTFKGKDECQISGIASFNEASSYDSCGGIIQRAWFAIVDGDTLSSHLQSISVNPNLNLNYNLPQNNTLVHCDSIDQVLTLDYSNNQMDICSITGNTVGQIDTSNFECGDTLSIVWNIETECGGMITEQRTFITYPRVVSNKKHLPIEYLSFRPNPVTNRLFINLDNFVNDQLEIEIYDLSGKRIKTIEASNNYFIDVSDLVDGVHLLRVVSTTKIGIARFVKI